MTTEGFWNVFLDVPRILPDNAENIKRRRNLAFVVFAVSLVIFTFTVCPSAPPGDSRYPLITIVGKIFSMVILYGSIAWRINFLSAVCDALAAALMYHLLSRVLRSESAGLIAATMFCFTPLMWTYALVAEVFALNNLLVVALLYLTTMFVMTQDIWYAKAGAVLMGLGLCNQHTISFYIIPLFPFILFYGRKVLFSSVWVLPELLAWGFLGLTPYIHLPIAAYRRTANAWGDHRTLRGVLKHFLREEYGTFQLASNHHAQHQWPQRIYLLTANYGWETLYYGFILTGVGLLVTFGQRKWRPVGLMLATTFTFYLLMFNCLANLDIYDPLLLGVQARFWQQSYIIMFMWLGWGWQYTMDTVVPACVDYFAPSLARFLPAKLEEEVPEPLKGTDADRLTLKASVTPDNAIKRHVPKGTPVRKLPETITYRGTISNHPRTLIAVAVLALIQICMWYSLVDQSDNWVTEQFCRSILEPLPPNAIAILKSDHIEFPVRYLQTVENFRSDVGAVNIDLMPYRWYRRSVGILQADTVFPGTHYSPGDIAGYNLKEFLDANMPRHRIFLCGVLPAFDQSWSGGYIMWAYGLSGEFLRNNDSVDLSYFDDNFRAIQSAAKVPVHVKGYPYIYQCWEYLVWRNTQECISINLNFFERVTDTYTHMSERVAKNLGYLYDLSFPFDRRACIAEKRNVTLDKWLSWEGSNLPSERDTKTFLLQIRNRPLQAELEVVLQSMKSHGQALPLPPAYRTDNLATINSSWCGDNSTQMADPMFTSVGVVPIKKEPVARIEGGLTTGPVPEHVWHPTDEWGSFFFGALLGALITLAASAVIPVLRMNWVVELGQPVHVTKPRKHKPSEQPAAAEIVAVPSE